MFHNKNAGNPERLDLLSDTRPVRPSATAPGTMPTSGLTAQVTPRNKLNIFWDEQRTCASCENGGNNGRLTSPEANAQGRPASDRQAGDVDVARAATGSPRVAASVTSPRWGGRAKQDPYTGDL